MIKMLTLSTGFKMELLPKLKIKVNVVLVGLFQLLPV